MGHPSREEGNVFAPTTATPMNSTGLLPHPHSHDACITNATAADSLAQRCDSALSRFFPLAVSW
jgi:hypothetical protein